MFVANMFMFAFMIVALLALVVQIIAGMSKDTKPYEVSIVSEHLCLEFDRLINKHLRYGWTIRGEIHSNYNDGLLRVLMIRTRSNTKKYGDFPD